MPKAANIGLTLGEEPITETSLYNIAMAHQYKNIAITLATKAAASGGSNIIAAVRNDFSFHHPKPNELEGAFQAAVKRGEMEDTLGHLPHDDASQHIFSSFQTTYLRT